ncbi:unnamed protein product [Schistosoma turkestanicum]|nr:unnamed protein product [Schistosoma turkestanicum]
MKSRTANQREHHNANSDLRLLDYQSKKLYKESIQLFNKLSLNHKEVKLILDYFEQLKSILLTDGKKYHEKLTKFRALVKLFIEKKTQIINKQISYVTSVKELENLLKNIEQILTEYKTEERMIAEALIQQEVELWQDCLNMEHRISCWESSDSKALDKIHFNNSHRIQSHSLSMRLTTTVGNNLPPEINEFQNYLDSHGGRTGGWSEDEHLKFLKHYKIHKSKYKDELKNLDKSINHCETVNHHHHQENELYTSTIDNNNTDNIEQQKLKENNLVKQDQHIISVFHQELANLLMTKTPEQIAEHEQWWNEFQRLEDAKRKAIQKWSENRRLNLQNRRQSSENIDNGNDSDRKSSEKQQKHQSISQIEARKAELELWRCQREEMKKRAELLRKQIEFQSKQAELESKQKRQAKIKQQISQYKQEKMAEQLTALHQLKIQTKMEQLIRQQKLHDAASRIEQRSLDQLNQLSARKKAKEQTEIPRQELIERIPIQTNIQVTRDPQRLCQLTKGWEFRLAQPKTQTIINQGLDLRANTGRMIPQWRRNL